MDDFLTQTSNQLLDEVFIVISNQLLGDFLTQTSNRLLDEVFIVISHQPLGDFLTQTSNQLVTRRGLHSDISSGTGSLPQNFLTQTSNQTLGGIFSQASRG